MGGRRRGNLNENPMILINISKKMGSKVSLETSRFVRTHMLAHTHTQPPTLTHAHSRTFILTHTQLTLKYSPLLPQPTHPTHGRTPSSCHNHL